MANKKDGDKQVSPQAVERSVIEPEVAPAKGADAVGSLDSSLLWFVARAADEMAPWGSRPQLRDRQLRAFYPNESYFLSALGMMVARNIGFSWRLTGLGKVIAPMQDVFDNADMGEGWENLVAKLSIDLYTQDNGAFMEVVRAGDSPSSALLGLNHLPAARCQHTGNPEYPVIYTDRLNVRHRLSWYQVSTLAEMPAPMERPPGIQLCALTRMLRAAQVIRNVTIYKEEKTGGRFARAMHIVQGLTSTQIQDSLTKIQTQADAQGVLKYIQPMIVPVTRPDARVDIKTLELASMPDGWDEEKAIKIYITIIAMAFLSDYQDFAPLPGGNLGTATQSEVLHMKSRGKGPAIFRKLLSHTLNHKILPKDVQFGFVEMDLAAEEDAAKIGKIRAETRKFQIESGELTVPGARQAAVDVGDISKPIFEMMGSEDITPEVTVTDEEHVKEADAPGAPFRDLSELYET